MGGFEALRKTQLIISFQLVRPKIAVLPLDDPPPLGGQSRAAGLLPENGCPSKKETARLAAILI